MFKKRYPKNPIEPIKCLRFRNGNIVMRLYHGSPIWFNDIAFKSGSFWTTDIEVAKSYGACVYYMDVEEKYREVFYLDSLKEHYINATQIPMYMVGKINFNKESKKL